MANDSQIGITLTANSTGVEAALAKLATGLDKTIDKLDKVEKASTRSATATQAGFDAAAGSALKFVGAITGIGAASALLATVNKELVAIQANQEAIRKTGVSAAQAVAGLKMNFTGDATLNVAQLEARLERIATATRTSVPTAADVASAVLSAGPSTNEMGMATVEAALALQPGNVAAARELGARAVNLSAASGVNDPKQLLGFMSNLQAQSNVRDIAQLGANGLPAVLASITRGDTPEAAAEMFGVLTKLKADATGAPSGTAQRSLVDQLMEFVPEKAGRDKSGRFRVPAEQMAAFAAAASPSARVDVLRENAELRRAFASKTSFGESQAAVDAYLAGTPAAMAVVRQVQAGIDPLGPGQVRNYESKLADIRSGKYQPGLSAEQQGSANLEGFALNSTLSARTATARKIHAETLESAGFGFLGRKIDAVGLEASMLLSDNPETAAANDLRSKARLLRSSDENFGLSENKERVAKLLERQAGLLEQTLKETQRSNELMMEQNRALRKDAAPQRPITVPSAALSRSTN